LYNTETELLFPMRVVSLLGDLRGAEWQALVAKVSGPDAEPMEEFAFVHMMVRLSGCVPCNTDSFRAMRGCIQCARHTIKRYRGTDAELINLFEQSKNEVRIHMEKR
jgi:hypothetical protein